VANATLFTTLGALGEAIALAQGLGLSREATYQILATTPLAAQAERRRESIESNDYPPRFPLALARKDASLIREGAETAGLDLRLVHGAERWLADAVRTGFGDRDYTAMLATILDAGGRAASHRPVPGRGRESGTGTTLLDPDGLIVDLDGVIWRGDEPIEGAVEAIHAVRARGVRVLFLTNEPQRSRDAVATRLTSMGISVASADVMTSSAATARAIRGLEGPKAQRVLVLGPLALTDEVEKAGVEVVSLDAAGDAEVVVVAGHEDFNYRELQAATIAIRNGARLFATGRDAVFPTAQGLRPATGAILAAVETAGDTSAVVVGKPERLIFDIARDALGGCRRVAVVGDHLVSDVAGAKRAGMMAILVLSGVTTRADLERADVLPDLVLESIADLPAALAEGWVDPEYGSPSPRVDASSTAR
jgi:4-nitrophenyl phosphatase